MTEITTIQEPFAPNVIRLEISAPGLPSLSFFDLPGVVVQDVDMDSHVPDMIRSLVKTYIEPSKSLVLLTLPIDVDRANSSAADLVVRAKAQDRTIGIISKPDRLVNANVKQWKEILAGKKFKFNLGYRVVKNPADPNTDHAEARQEEQRFFLTHPMFSGELRMFRDRFGTDRLKEFLSERLMTMITECLPEIEGKIADRVTIIEEELRTLPKEPAGNIYIDIQQRLLNFEGRLAAIINNSVDLTSNTGWFQLWHREAQAFFEKLIQTAPELDTATLSGTTSDQSQAEDDNSDSTSANQGSPRRNLNQRPIFNIIPIHFDHCQKQAINAAVCTYTKKFTLLQLRDRLHAVNGGAYGTGDPRVFEQLVKESTEHWSDVCKVFRVYTAKICSNLVNELLRHFFGDLINTQLFRVIKESVHAFLKRLDKEQAEISKRLLRIELGKPFTVDREIQEMSKHSVRQQLTEQLQKAIFRNRVREMETGNKKISDAEKRRILDQVKSEPSHNHQELNELAGAIAYYKIAARRFADNICLTIRNEFFQEMARLLWRQICTDIGIRQDADPNQVNKHLQELTAPSARDSNRRKELESELRLLEQNKKDVMEVVNTNQRYNLEDF